MMLSEIIIERIKKDGPISFRDYMDMALYYPKLGYYNSAENKIGSNGDFYTSANLSVSFGAMIGRQIEEMWRFLGNAPFTIVEYGAGTGLLCRDILDYLKVNKSLYDNLNYCIIEKSNRMQEIEKKYLTQKVSWYSSLSDIPEIKGCVLSNELVDNFPVHQVVMEEELKEVFVDYDKGFKEVLFPAKKELKQYIQDLNLVFPKDFRTEINLDALKWLKEIAHYLKEGYLMTIDYGSESAELYSESRSSGTLLCYSKHQKNENPYQFIGNQDITSHTNFSALQRWGLKYGIKFCGLTSQANFLIGLGIRDYQNKAFKEQMSNNQQRVHESYVNYRLLMNMSSKFKVLIQQKGVSENKLSGLAFSKSKKK
jgi:SAM-dependent MidA family methyltransferase